MKLSTKSILNLEALEERLTPAFDFFYNPAGDIWTVTQVQDDGDATITVDAITNDLVVDDGAGGPVTVGVALGSLTVHLMDNSSGDLTVQLDEFLFGNVSIHLGNGGDFDGDGNRNLDLTGISNTVLGNFSVTGGTSDQVVDLSTLALLSVGGSFNMNLGLGNDAVFATSGVSVGGSMSLFNVNFIDIDSAGATVGGNVSIRMTDNEPSFYNISAGVSVIGGNFTYTGGNSTDVVFLDGGDIIGGSVNIYVGNDILGGLQGVALEGATIGGNLTFRGGTIDGADLVSSDVDTIIGGSIYVNTGTLGDDIVTLLGTNGGNAVSVITGLGDDVIDYGMIGANARLYASMSLGDDTFILGDNVTLSYLYIDFGFGSDIYTSLYVGPYPFRVYLRNLP